MPQLSFMRSPVGLQIVVGARMPDKAGGRWCVSAATSSADNRSLGEAVWSVPADHEQADIGHWFRATYDSWFNGDPYHVLDAAERHLRILRP